MELKSLLEKKEEVSFRVLYKLYLFLKGMIVFS